MKRAFLGFLFAVVSVSWIFGVAVPAALAGDGWHSGCAQCSGGYRSCCDWLCPVHVVDGCTICNWRRTWWGPNALATPLRQYYIPRPPECSQCDGYKYGYVLGSYPAADSCVAADSAISPDAAAGFWPGHFERLGQIRNELDELGPASMPRHAPPGR
jgi:hypothetical protein